MSIEFVENEGVTTAIAKPICGSRQIQSILTHESTHVEDAVDT
jgi:hypothetical protein